MFYLKKLSNLENFKLSFYSKKTLYSFSSVWGKMYINKKVSFFFKKNVYIFVFQKKSKLNSLFKKIYFNLWSVKNPYLGIITLKGLGFKSTLLNFNLIIRVGFSHLFYINIPKTVQVCVFNKFSQINIFGINLKVIKDIYALLWNIKKPDFYKKEGFYFNNLLKIENKDL